MPSDPANFHVYKTRESSPGRTVPYLIASTTEDGLGACLRVLHEEGAFDAAAVGVLMRDADGDGGVWLINPFAGRK